MNPITQCLDSLHLGDDTKLRRKAQEFQGQVDGIPNKIFAKGGPNLKPVLSIQLAYESMKNYDWDIKLASKLAGCTVSNYENALSIVLERLDLQPIITLDMLAVALGSSTMLSHANDLWQDFIENYTRQLSGAAQKKIAQKELEQSCWKGAILFVCAKAFGKTMEKDQLHRLCGCSTAQLNKSIKIVSATCEKKIEALKNGSTTTCRKRKVDDNEEEEAETDGERDTESGNKKRKAVTTQTQTKKMKPISGIVSMIDYMDYKRTKTFNDYKKWKSDLVQQLAASRT